MNASSELLKNKSKVPLEFDTIASKYDLATWFSRGYQQDLNTSASRIPLKGNETRLDLCCGTGKSTLACLKLLPHGNITAVDNSSQMLDIARTRFAGTNVKLLQQDAMNLEFPDESFDVIFMAYGIRNMPDYDLCLKGLYRILKPNGIICFHEYILNKGIAARWYWNILGYGFIVPFCSLLTGNASIFLYLVKSVSNFPTADDFTQILRKNGFVNIRVMPLNGWRAPILKTVLAVKPNK
jgi:ubiquinone/menaquinone biosynthesis methyltransferase